MKQSTLISSCCSAPVEIGEKGIVICTSCLEECEEWESVEEWFDECLNDDRRLEK